jgi:flagellar biosynthesis protein
LAHLPRPGAVALRYNPQAPFLDAAPRLVAKGEGLLADRILKLARENGIPIERDPDLLAALQPLEIDRMLPPELFKAVAIMLAALYRANGLPGGIQP